MLRIGICGACGKMGRKIALLALKDPGINLCAALEKEGCAQIGKDIGTVLEIGEIGVKISSDPEEVSDKIDCLIDFTSPETTVSNADMYSKKGISLVIGTTGLDETAVDKIREASRTVPVVFSPNMAIGVNALFILVEKAVKLLRNDFNVKIEETHHIHKKDSPSGTAKKLGKIISDTAGIYPIIEAYREGEVVGIHGVMFESEFERLEIRHDAKSRDVFAVGALKAAKFLSGKSPWLYDMSDVLGIEE